MSHRRVVCSRFLDVLDAFILGRLRLGELRRASRLVPAELSEHVGRCARCSHALSRRLVESGLVASGLGDSGFVETEFTAKAGEEAGWGRAAASPGPRRWTAIALRGRAGEFDEIRRQVGRVVAHRALRHLATLEGRRRDAVHCAAAEIVDAKAAIARLNEVASAFDDDIASELYGFAALLEDAEHVAETFEKVRLSGLLVPRPPALPQRRDRFARSRVEQWAARMLDSRSER